MISKLKSLGKVLRTVSHLKPIQVAYQLKNRFTRPGLLTEYIKNDPSSEQKLTLSPLPSISPVLRVEGTQYEFTFLNQVKIFKDHVNWGEESFGKLWNYNLQYVDFLRQKDISEEAKLGLLYNLYEWLEKRRIKLEPYPVSLRVLNVIRFLNQQKEPDKKLQQWVNAEINYLTNNLEYHLLGNHLLENGFAILMAAYYFNHPKWIKLAEKLLKAELKEQILEDGGHFELSPMYHQIILFRILEAYSFLPETSPIYNLCQKLALKMLGWLNEMTFNNGTIPHFNDSIDGIAFTTEQLLKIAKDLRLINVPYIHLSSSGYRKLSNDEFELIADIHGISPKYQPGHAHADHLSFVMQVNGLPFIVDQGISTYQIGERRVYERSTKAHNTVTVNDQNTSEVWSGFRVGRRPQVTVREATQKMIIGVLNYGDLSHERVFSIKENLMVIEDHINFKGQAISRFYFHPNVSLEAIKKEEIHFSNGVIITVENADDIRTIEFLYNLGYNKKISSKGVEIGFHRYCKTTIKAKQ